MITNKTILYAYWASTCSWRARAGLYYKNIPFEERPVDIHKQKDQLTQKYTEINPAQKVPALVIDGETIVESMAILQYLEDTRPEPTLVPSTPLLRARMREICETVVSGIQPLQSLSLEPHFESSEKFVQFMKFWNTRGLEILETLLENTAGTYCVGNQFTLADICFLPQLHSATKRHQLDITKYPTVLKLYEKLQNEEVFQETHPKKLIRRKFDQTTKVYFTKLIKYQLSLCFE